VRHTEIYVRTLAAQGRRFPDWLNRRNIDLVNRYFDSAMTAESASYWYIAYALAHASDGEAKCQLTRPEPAAAVPPESPFQAVSLKRAEDERRASFEHAARSPQSAASAGIGACFPGGGAAPSSASSRR
jgi:hypothetical protein